MNQYIVEGSYPIRGRVRASGNKNSALPCIAAALLSDEPVILRNVPDIEDVHVMFEVLEKLGATVRKEKPKGSYRISASNITTSELPLSQLSLIHI